MKLFIAVLIAAIATQNAVIAQTTSTVPTEMTMTTTAESGTMMNATMMNATMMMSSSSGDMDSDVLAGTASNAASETTGSGPGNSTMNAGDGSAAGTSGAVSIQSVTFTTSAVVAGLAAAFFF